MARVQGERNGLARVAIWLTLCAIGALHVFISLRFVFTAEALGASQLAVTLILGLTAVKGLRLGAGWTLGGLFLNLVLSAAVFYAGVAIIVAGFH